MGCMAAAGGHKMLINITTIAYTSYGFPSIQQACYPLFNSLLSRSFSNRTLHLVSSYAFCSSRFFLRSRYEMSPSVKMNLERILDLV